MQVYSAVKGQQKSTEFYLTTMDYGDIATLVVLPEDLLGSKLLDDEQQMQRKLSWTRVKGEMKNYLLKADDAFYSALTLFMIPRDLSVLREGEGYEFVAAEPKGNHGTLEIRSTCVLFPGDGQHRAASIKEAVREDSSLAQEQVPVVLIPFKSRSKVRQLFSDLNLNAKPVNRTIGYSFETRDPLTLVTKEVANQVSLFHERVNRRSNSLPATSDYVITLNTLVVCDDILLKGLGLKDANLEDVSVRSDVITQLSNVWKTIVGSFDAWSDVMAGTASPAELREAFLYPHGMGWQVLAVVAAKIIEAYPSASAWETRIPAALKGVSWNRDAPIWQGKAVIEGRVNNTGPAVRDTAKLVLDQAGIPA